jgi:hypothetical protein
MKFLTPEVLISIFILSAVLFFKFSTSLSLFYCQLFPQHAQHLYFITGSYIPYMCCNINTLMVKKHSPVVSEMDNILRLRLESTQPFGCWIYHRLLIDRGKERTYHGGLARYRQPKSLDKRQYPKP